MGEIAQIAIAVLVVVNCALTVVLLLRRRGEAPAVDLHPVLDAVGKAQERTERVLRDEFSTSRNENAAGDRETRSEIGASFKSFGDSVGAQMAQIAAMQKGQLDTFSNQLAALTQTNESRLEAVRQTVETNLASLAKESAERAAAHRAEDKQNFDGFCQALVIRIGEAATQQKEQLAIFHTALKALTDASTAQLAEMRNTVERKLGQMQAEANQAGIINREEAGKNLRAFAETLLLQIKQMSDGQREQLGKFEASIQALTNTSEQKLEKVRETVETRLTALQTDNGARLEQMRQTVDEKLHATLEQRLGESFKIVSERLELVHKGLGEMQSLANGVGDLKKVLTNIKTRGTWGEVQLGNLLEQMLTPEQYATNVQVNPQTLDRVEYAIKLPGKDVNGNPVWLPIDAKFPQEDYQRLVDAAETGDADSVAENTEALSQRVYAEAKKIRDKYICAPHTTDFAILFLPTEGLFAEVLRRPGLCDRILHDYRVVLTGPTTLAAVLSSLQMGFRTLAIEKRSSEVWQVLGLVKTEFTKFGDVLDKVHKKLQEASNTVESAQTRKRVMDRALKGVEGLPAEMAAEIMRAVPALDLQPVGETNGH